jgi:NADPH-dependent glutamate synthase beta subunit-like oxidoreductase
MSAAAPDRPLAGRAIAVIGGATAGAEVAGRLAEAGARVVVFEQNRRPYGKIEDGLPRWHAELRRKEYRTIDAKLGQPGVTLVPETRVGRDVGFEELVREWGFHAVVLANGAWRDRPLPVEGADAWVGRGLVYQNPFIVWFNHAGEKDWQGPAFAPADDVIVVGGGLASIDVAKVLMLETARARLRERGLDAPLLELEVKGIPKVLERHGLRFEDLGLRGCTLFYRRRVEDMPLVGLPDDATPERRAKVEGARRRLVEKAIEKFRFHIEPLAAPDGLLIEGDRLVGLRFRRTKMEHGKLVATDETFERRGAYVISSIGSIPEPIPGIAMKGELFAFTDWDLGRLAAWPTVYSAGNVVTGKGNIVASRNHAAHVAEQMAEELRGRAAALAEQVTASVAARPAHDDAARAALEARVRARQQAVGYPGDYPAWIARVTPPDLE